MAESACCEHGCLDEPAHPLDNVVWNALTTRQSELALGNPLARRYDPDFAPFAATPDASGGGLEPLEGITRAGDEIIVLSTGPIRAPIAFQHTDPGDVLQMVLTAVDSAPAGHEQVELGTADGGAMRDLVAATRPGPFSSRTHEMGRFLGVRMDGRLVAMTGERMRLEGFTEISGVCCDEAYRGLGLPAELVRAIASAILARGETPFLHVFANNHLAIALYRRLGFKVRRSLHTAVLRRVAS